MTSTITDKSTVIAVSLQFTRFPAGRFNEDGPFSGQAFRESFLVPAMQSGRNFLVELDGTAGYGSSFLEEAFGGLVRAGWSVADIGSRMQLKCSDSSIVDEINDYMRNAGLANG